MHRWLRVLLIAAPVLGCYRDVAGPVSGSGLTRVLLTDAPTSLPSVDRVEVYVAAIAASTTDAAEPADWITIATPERCFDFASLRQGKTVLAGSGILPVGRYRAVRITLRGDSSAVVYADGARARVRWPGPDPFTVHAAVAEPLAVPLGGGVLVLDLDVTRSFAVAFDPLFDLVFTPALRAVDAAVSGALAGTVYGSADGGPPRPVAYATIRVYRGAVRDPGTLVATGTTETSGGYLVGFLPRGAYTVEIAAPTAMALGSITIPDVLIAAGAESRLQVVLPRLLSAHRIPPPSTLVQGPPHVSHHR